MNSFFKLCCHCILWFLIIWTIQSVFRFFLFAPAMDLRVGHYPCPLCPRCDREKWNSAIPKCYCSRVLRCVWGCPPLRRVFMEDLRYLFSEYLIATLDMKTRLLDAVEMKLYHEDEPMVLHLTGDNGVGKTHIAQLISVATSLRCQVWDNGWCRYGDNTLVLSGASYSASTDTSIQINKMNIIDKVMKHKKKYPHGIVLIDEAQSIPSSLFQELQPLFGKADSFGAATPKPGSSLKGLMIILTSDYGKEARTENATTQEELDKLSMDQLQNVFSFTIAHAGRSFNLPHLNELHAAQLRDQWIKSLPCRVKPDGELVGVDLGADTINWLEEGVDWRAENGRSFYKKLGILSTSIKAYWDNSMNTGKPLRAAFYLEPDNLNPVLYNALRSDPRLVTDDDL